MTEVGSYATNSRVGEYINELEQRKLDGDERSDAKVIEDVEAVTGGYKRTLTLVTYISGSVKLYNIATIYPNGSIEQ